MTSRPSLPAPAGPAVDVEWVRQQTPGAGLATHLNAAGASLASTGVLDAVRGHLELEARIGGYEAAALAAEVPEDPYRLAAELLGGRPGEVALVESATVGWQRFVDALRLVPGDRVVATSSSYVSTAMHLIDLADTRGVQLEVVGCDDTGGVDLAALATALARPAALVTAAHVPTSSGLVEPVAAIGALARANDTPFLLDATQSLGQLSVDVTEIGCDALVATGRKFLRGPRGTGLLWVADPLADRLRPTAPDVRGATWTGDRDVVLAAGARRLETWETSHALRRGLARALAELREVGVLAVHQHVTALAARLRTELAGVPGVRVTDPPAAASGLLTFVVGGQSPRESAAALRSAGVHVVAVPAGHGRWDLGRRGIDAVVRASVHVYNDDADGDRLVDAVAGLVRPGGRRP